MADLDKIAGQVAEVAQRVADVLDAARENGDLYAHLLDRAERRRRRRETAA
jgi:hypothetical protein